MLTQEEDDLSDPVVQLAILREQARRNVYRLGRAKTSLKLANTKMTARRLNLGRQRTKPGMTRAKFSLGRSEVWVVNRRLNLCHRRTALDKSKADIRRLLAS